MRVGDRDSLTKTITESDVNCFADISGDHNPLHLDDIEASKSVFNKRIAHGFLVGSLLSAVIGMKLPGKGTIYLEQNMKFKNPVYIGDTITATVEVDKIINKEKGIVGLYTNVLNQNGVIVIDGNAVVKVNSGVIE